MGKSSLTTQLALSLSLTGHSVGILDIDLTGPSIPRFLGVEDAKVTQAPGGWLPVEIHPTQILPRSYLRSPPANQDLTRDLHVSASSNGQEFGSGQLPNVRDHPANGQIGSLHVMSLGFLLPSRSSAVVWRGPKKTAMVRQFLTSVIWPPELSYLLVDTPPGTSDEHISLAETLLSSISSSPSHQQSVGALVVTTPQAIATSDVRKEINFCHKVGIRILGVVENMSGYVCECCGVETNIFGKGGGESMSAECGVRFLGRVPIDVQWGVLVEEGKRPRYGHNKAQDSDEDLRTTRTISGEGDDGSRPTVALSDDVNGNSAHNPEPQTLAASLKGENGTTTRAPFTVQDSDDQNLLLVDKYRNCALYPVLKDITKQIVRVVDRGEEEE